MPFNSELKEQHRSVANHIQHGGKPVSYEFDAQWQFLAVRFNLTPHRAIWVFATQGSYEGPVFGINFSGKLTPILVG